MNVTSSQNSIYGVRFTHLSNPNTKISISNDRNNLQIIYAKNNQQQMIDQTLVTLVFQNFCPYIHKLICNIQLKYNRQNRTQFKFGRHNKHYTKKQFTDELNSSAQSTLKK